MHSIFTRSILAAALVFAGARCVVALCVIALGSATAFAQSRTAPENAAAGTSVPGTPAPEAPAPDASRGGIDGLPDAVTVLDILTRLPRRPGSDPATANDGPPDGGPKPRGKTPGTVADAPPRPSRVVNLDPARPFVPRPSPRAAGAPPVITGAVVPQIRDREVIVTLAANATDATVSELGQDLGLDGDTLYASNLLGARVVLFRIPDTRSVADVLQQLAGDARVQLAQPNYVFSASGAAEQPLPVPQYAPKAINLDEAHRTALGKRVRVAIIDTAIDITHPSFDGAVTMSFDALGGTKPEAAAHGTAIAGIVSARSHLIGVAPEANILSVRAFAGAVSSSAQSHTLAILKSLDWSVLNSARIVNMSFAGPNDPLLGQAITAAVKQGVTIVAAAGNGGPDASPAYPGAFPNVIAVTAIDDHDAIYKSANRGTYIAVAAPGVDIIGAAPKGAYDISSGTSMAAAHVSGVAALLLEKNPKLTPRDIRDALSKSARQPPRLIAEDMGAGIVDAAEALRMR